MENNIVTEAFITSVLSGTSGVPIVGGVIGMIQEFPQLFNKPALVLNKTQKKYLSIVVSFIVSAVFYGLGMILNTDNFIVNT